MSVIIDGSNGVTTDAVGKTGNLLTLPASDGAAGQFLQTNGSGTLSFAAAGTSWQTKSADYTAVNNDYLLVNTSGGAVTITLPATPSTGDYVYFLDAAGTFQTYNLTVARNGETIQGTAENLTVSTNNVSFGLVYTGSTWQIW